jgi:hypothetical protein
MPYSFVTVVFDDELPLLGLQARSMRIFLPLAMVEEIVVVANERSPLLLERLRHMLPEYGVLAERVRILTLEDFPPIPKTSGWVSQQVLKLLVATHVRTPRYVVLDPKTHLIATPEESFFTHSDGRPKIIGCGYENHTLVPYLKRSLSYFDLRLDEYIQLFATSVAPFVIITDIACELINVVGSTPGLSFAEVFIEERVSEFFLYAAWIAKTRGDVQNVYHYHYDRHSPIIWEHRTSLPLLREEILAKIERSPFMSIHRRAIPKMRREGLEYIADVWCRCGLFDTQKDALMFLYGFRKGYRMAFYKEIAARKFAKLFRTISFAEQ